MTKSRDLANAATALNAVTATELGYVDGVTSAIQTQIDAKLATATAATTYVANSLADAKGDLLTATADNTPARLAVGSNGDTLVADSSTSTGLRYTAGTVQANPVLNSAMQLWQRGTSFAITTPVYTADRWMAGRAANTAGTTVTRQVTGDTTNLPNIQYALRFQRDSGNTTTSTMYLSQAFESINSIPFAGKTITVSYYARSGANFSPVSSIVNFKLQSGTGTDQNNLTGAYTGSSNVTNVNSTLTTTWQRFSSTGTVAATATELAFLIETSPTGTAGANDWFEMTGLQIDIGSVALPFRTNGATIQGERAACNRYFQVSQFGVGKANGTTTALVQVVWNNMRIAPSYSIPSLNSILLEIGVAYRTPTSSSLNSITANVSNGCSEIYFQGASGMTTGNLVNIGGDSIQFSAEL
jgi:hypothetical protein